MTYRKRSPPQIEFRSYDTNLNSYESKIDLICSKNLSRMLNSDGTIDRGGDLSSN